MFVGKEFFNIKINISQGKCEENEDDIKWIQ